MMGFVFLYRNKTCFQGITTVLSLELVRVSSYGEVWRALKKLELRLGKLLRF